MLDREYKYFMSMLGVTFVICTVFLFACNEPAKPDQPTVCERQLTVCKLDLAICRHDLGLK